MCVAWAAVLGGTPGSVVGADEKPKVALQIEGSTTVGPIADEFTEVFKKLHPEITITVKRGAEVKDIHVTPELRGNKGIIGIGIREETKSIQPGPLGALWMSLERNYEFSGLIFQTLGGLLTRDTSPRQLMGPVAIAQLSGEYAAAGLIALFSLMASISLNLGILNLLPVPVLDGGHIFIMALEGLARRDFSARVKEQLLLVGFVLLMALMVTVIYNDLTRIQWVERFMFWR